MTPPGRPAESEEANAGGLDDPRNLRPGPASVPFVPEVEQLPTLQDPAPDNSTPDEDDTGLLDPRVTQGPADSTEPGAPAL